MKPIPAPAAHLVKKPSRINPRYYYRSALGPLKSQMAVHEYLGMF